MFYMGVDHRKRVVSSDALASSLAEGDQMVNGRFDSKEQTKICITFHRGKKWEQKAKSEN